LEFKNDKSGVKNDKSGVNNDKSGVLIKIKVRRKTIIYYDKS
jgi:hypothetical protein